MNYDFTQFIYKRCDRALVDNEDYMKLEQDENTDPDELQAKAEELCYRQGFRDAFRMLLS